MSPRYLMIAILGCVVGATAGCRPKCHPRTKAYMEDWLARLCQAEARAFRPPGTKGPHRSPGEEWQHLRLARANRPPLPSLPPAPLLRVGPSATWLGAKRLSEAPSPAELRLALGLPARPGPGGLHLAIAPSTKLTRVTELLRALGKVGPFEVTFLVEPATAPLLPSAPAAGHQVDLERVLASADPRERRELLRRRIAVMAHRANCGALDTLVAEVLGSPPQGQCRKLESALPALVARCACRMDWRRLLTLVRLLLGPYEFVGSWSGRLSPEPSAGRGTPRRVITVSRHARWVDVVGRVVELPPSAFWIELI